MIIPFEPETIEEACERFSVALETTYEAWRPATSRDAQRRPRRPWIYVGHVRRHSSLDDLDGGDVNGVTVTPEGWMWVLGFALAGCEWAIKQALDPAFEIDKKFRTYEIRPGLYHRRKDLEALEARIKKTRAEIEQLAFNLNIEGER